jgi:hypothetical protein
MDLVRAKGMFSFYEDGHQECCRVRKVSKHTALHVRAEVCDAAATAAAAANAAAAATDTRSAAGSAR